MLAISVIVLIAVGTVAYLRQSGCVSRDRPGYSVSCASTKATTAEEYENSYGEPPAGDGARVETPEPTAEDDPAQPTGADLDRQGERAIEAETKRELQRTITKDAREQVANGVLDGPILKTSCSRVGGGSGKTKRYECIAVTERSGGTERGYPYDATANPDTGRITWKASS